MLPTCAATKVAFVGANVISMDGDQVSIDRTVVIEDGLITAIEEGAVSTPGDVQRSMRRESS